MRKLLLVVFGLVLMGSLARGVEVEVQTSWYLGPGELGPVLHWGERFYLSDSVVHTIPGQLTLMASGVDYDSWTKHTIELNSNIEAHADILPAYMDGDGYLDLVAVIGGTENKVVWYERTTEDYARGYVKRVVGDFTAGFRATTWPWDMDGDGDIDIVASGGEGLVWFANENLTFTKKTIDVTSQYLYARPGDMDNDGDIDIVTHDVSEGQIWGDLWLFRNNGAMGFSRELIYNASGHEIWRINLADFNGDQWLDIQTSDDPVFVFLNDGTGHFVRSYVYDPINTIDGSWPNDFDQDGDVDIMGATWGGGSPPRPLFWLENDGTGTSFTYRYIGGDSGDYGDGGMATDVDLDGLMDALGTYRYVGWFEQRPDGGFDEHRLPDSYFYDSHWIYGENLDGGPCIGDVDIDILATKVGEFAWWENTMVTFAAQAWLESSILDAEETVVWQRFGWDDHVPRGNELRYRVRSGATVGELLASPWSSPILFSGDTLLAYGILPGQYFQYRVEFERITGMPDRSPTVYEVWVETTPRPRLVTGGGWIPGDPPGPGQKRTFGFNAHFRDEAVWGQLQFVDHATKMRVHSDTVKTVVIQPGDTIADFSGDCRVDGVRGYSFECEVMDRGEPGHYVDWFSINVYDGAGNPYYSAGDFLGGGNIQIHEWPSGSFAGDIFAKGEPELGGETGDTPCDMGEGRQVLSPGAELSKNSPNPFRSTTVIRYQIPGLRAESREPMYASLKVYDLTGKLVRTLADGIQPAGRHAVEWDGKDNTGRKVTAGIYIYRLLAGDVSFTRKLVVVR